MKRLITMDITTITELYELHRKQKADIGFGASFDYKYIFKNHWTVN